MSVTIPRILHRTVPEKTTPNVDRFWKRFGELHPDWDLRTYREPINPDDWPMTGYLFEKCQNGAQKAGLIRLEALYTHGGVYVDSDCEPYRSLEPLLGVKAFAAWEDEKVVPDAVLGAVAEHPAFLELIGRARMAVDEGQDAWASGPGGTTEILPNRDDVLLLPPGAFYPAHYLEKSKLGSSGAKPWVFLEHKWHHSWGSQQQRAQIERAQRTRRAPAPEAPPPAPSVVTTVENVAVCVPWDGTTDPHRQVAHAWCMRFWDDAGLHVFEGTGSSRAAMRNDAVQKAIASGAEILLLVDADTWVPIDQVNAASSLASTTGRLTHAFTGYCRLGSATSKMYLRSRHVRAESLARTTQKQVNHISGATAIPVTLWNELGGYDERFTGWGLEDRAFEMAAECLGDGIERVPGFAIHWYHPPDRDKGTKRSNDDERTALILRYCAAAGKIPGAGRVARIAQAAKLVVSDPDPTAVKAVLSEEGGPLGMPSHLGAGGARDVNMAAM